MTPRERDIAILHSALPRVSAIIDDGILHMGGPTVRYEAMFTSAVINMYDTLSALDKLGRRITEKGPDLPSQVPKRSKDGMKMIAEPDLTHLIEFCRNASTHVMGGNSAFNGSYLRFCTAIADAPLHLGGTVLTCEYPDDVAIFYGPVRTYVRRNLYRAFQLAARGILINGIQYPFVGGIRGFPEPDYTMHRMRITRPGSSPILADRDAVVIGGLRCGPNEYDRDRISFQAVSGNQRIECFISLAALSILPGTPAAGSPAAALAIFERQRPILTDITKAIWTYVAGRTPALILRASDILILEQDLQP